MSQFGFCSCDKILTKSNLGQKGFMSSYRFQSFIGEARAGTQDKDLAAGNEAETMEGTTY